MKWKERALAAEAIVAADNVRITALTEELIRAQARIDTLEDRLDARDLTEFKAASSIEGGATGSWTDPADDPLPEPGGGGYFLKPAAPRS